VGFFVDNEVIRQAFSAYFDLLINASYSFNCHRRYIICSYITQVGEARGRSSENQKHGKKITSNFRCFKMLLCPFALHPETLTSVIQLATILANYSYSKTSTKNLKFRHLVGLRIKLFFPWTFRTNVWYLYVLHVDFDH